jgi:hypothetical protein
MCTIYSLLTNKPLTYTEENSLGIKTAYVPQDAETHVCNGCPKLKALQSTDGMNKVRSKAGVISDFDRWL